MRRLTLQRYATGIERETLLEWLRAFAVKARRDRTAPTVAEFDELARVVARLTPDNDALPSTVFGV